MIYNGNNDDDKIKGLFDPYVEVDDVDELVTFDDQTQTGDEANDDDDIPYGFEWDDLWDSLAEDDVEDEDSN